MFYWQIYAFTRLFYICEAHGTTSWLDHCITNKSGQSIIFSCLIIDDIVCSDHLPLCIEINCDVTPICESISKRIENSIPKWHLASEADTQAYFKTLLYQKMHYPVRMLTSSPTGMILIVFDNYILPVLRFALMKYISKYINKEIKNCQQIPGWNEYVAEHHTIARDAFK